MSDMTGPDMNSAAIYQGSGRYVAVTGGTSGIGRMIAEGFAAAGAKVIICARNAEACARVAAEITAAYPGSCTGVAVDLAARDGVEKFAVAVGAGGEALHALVNCAGSPLVAPIEEYPEDGWDHVFDLNLRASFFLVKRLLPLLQKGSAKNWQSAIINIGSIAGVRIQARENYAYAASKAGLHYLTRSLSKHLGPKGISVNAIAPGLFLTEMTSEYASTFIDGFINATPMRRLGEKRDVADLACFLASPSGIFLTGTVIPLDGGVAA